MMVPPNTLANAAVKPSSRLVVIGCMRIGKPIRCGARFPILRTLGGWSVSFSTPLVSAETRTILQTPNVICDSRSHHRSTARSSSLTQVNLSAYPSAMILRFGEVHLTFKNVLSVVVGFCVLGLAVIPLAVPIDHLIWMRWQAAILAL